MLPYHLPGGGEFMNNKYIWIGVLAIIIVLSGGFLLLNNKATSVPAQNTQTTQKQTPSQQKALQTKQEDITVTSTGFTPQTITVKAGTKVVWTNKSGGPVTVNSDVHPTHLLWPFLNLGKFDDGSSVSVVFETAGTYTYHNHLNASQTGKVIVQ